MSSLVYVSRNLIDYANYSNGDLAGRRGAGLGDTEGVPSTHPAQIITIMFTNLHREDEWLASWLYLCFL